MNYSREQSVADKFKKVEKRYSKTTKGTAQKAKPKVKVKPTGNPLKKKIGVKVEYKF